MFWFVVSVMVGGALSQDDRIYFVSPLGNDQNNGSGSAPFATLQRAYDVATIGFSWRDTLALLFLLPGEYDAPAFTLVVGNVPTEVSSYFGNPGDVIFDCGDSTTPMITSSTAILPAESNLIFTMAGITFQNCRVPPVHLSACLNDATYYQVGVGACVFRDIFFGPGMIVDIGLGCTDKTPGTNAMVEFDVNECDFLENGGGVSANNYYNTQKDKSVSLLVSIEQSKFTNVAGAAVAVTNSLLSIDQSDFVTCGSDTASTIYAISSSINMTFVQMTNCAGKDGGAIQLVQSKLQGSTLDLQRNTASAYGGALYLQTSQASLVNTTIAFNNATLSGGAVYCDDMTSTFLCTTCTIGNNPSKGSANNCKA